MASMPYFDRPQEPPGHKPSSLGSACHLGMTGRNASGFCLILDVEGLGAGGLAARVQRDLLDLGLGLAQQASQWVFSASPRS